MGTIEKRGQNSWRVGVRLPTSQGRGWVRRTYTYPDTMTEEEQRKAVQIELARLVVDVADGNAAPTKKRERTVRDLADIWMEQHVEPSCKPTTASFYRALLYGRVLPLIGAKPAASLTPMDVTRMLNTLRAAKKKSTALPENRDPAKADKPLSDRTIRHCYDVLNYMYNKCVQWDLVKSNPLEKVDRPKARKRRLVALDDDQAIDLLRKLSGEESLSYRCAVLLALTCGLRLGEVCGLYWTDVNFKDFTVNITRALHYVPGKGNYMDTPKSAAGERLISLPAGMMTLLHETLAYQQELATLLGDSWHGDGRIVCGWDGSPVHHDTPSKWFRKFADRNGFQGVRFQDLRHAHASILLANNMDAVAVAARLGHESPDTTFRFYAHAIRRRDQESAAAFQRILDRVPEK